MSKTATVTKLKHAQELFLLLIVEQDLSATEAYAKAYPRCKASAVPSCTTRLLKNAKVIARKGELEAEKALVVRAASRITTEFLTKELLSIARQASLDKQHSAASAAMMGIAKIHGMLVEKHVIDAVVRKPSSQPQGPDEMSELEWLQEYGPTITLEATDSIEILPEAETSNE